MRDQTGIKEGTAHGLLPNAFPTVVNRASPLIVALGNAAGEKTLRIYDIRGRLVKTIQAADGSTRAIWTFGDESGKRIPAGVYLVGYGTGRAMAMRKLIIAE